MSTDFRAMRSFTHTVVTSDGRKHKVTANGADQHGWHPERAVSIRPIRQLDGTWPSLTGKAS